MCACSARRGASNRPQVDLEIVLAKEEGGSARRHPKKGVNTRQLEAPAGCRLLEPIMGGRWNSQGSQPAGPPAAVEWVQAEAAEPAREGLSPALAVHVLWRAASCRGALVATKIPQPPNTP